MDLRELLEEKGFRWHPSRNGDLNPEELLPGSRKRIWLQCSRNHEWEVPAYSVKSGSGCPYCFGRNAIPGETDLATTHPHLLKMWSDRNDLRPNEVTAGSHKRVWWICGKGHQWEAAIGSVASEDSGCPYCAEKRAIPGETDLATVRPDMLAEWDFEKNILKPTAVLPSAHDKVWWKCGLGHS